MKLKVPYFKQRDEWTCGPASLQMAMSFLGEFRTQEEIEKIIGLPRERIEEEGITNEKMVEAAQKVGFYCYVNKETTVEEIKYFLHLNLPVIVNYIEPKDQDGHFALVHGYDRLTKKIIMHDPFHGKNLKLSEKKFLDWWKSGYENHTHWMMVLSKEPFRVGMQFAPLRLENSEEEGSVFGEDEIAPQVSLA